MSNNNKQTKVAVVAAVAGVENGGASPEPMPMPMPEQEQEQELPKIVAEWAGHFSDAHLGGGSDKVWAISYDTQGTLKSCWGRRGASLQKGETILATQAAAAKQFQKKVNSKLGEGYKPVSFDDAAYGIASFGKVSISRAVQATPPPPLPLIVSVSVPSAEVETTNSTATATTVSNVNANPKFITSHLTPLLNAEVELEDAIRNPNIGISAKVNGERCVIECACVGVGIGVGKLGVVSSSSEGACGTTNSTNTANSEADADDATTAVAWVLSAYNRKGIKVASVPQAALSLTKLGCQFVIDGERMTGVQAGQYVMFDLLEWQGEDLRSWPYAKRVKTLEDALVKAGLISKGRPTCWFTTTDTAVAATVTATKDGLYLLTAETDPITSWAIYAEVKASGGEGVVFRTMDATYQVGDTKFIRKFKFVDDLDAIVVGIQPGIRTGSVRLALRRTSDNELVEVGNVRSGLTDADITTLDQMLQNGLVPVLKVEYLPIRTVGTRLVEPKTSITCLRTDKRAWDCTTEQFNSPAKTLLFDNAKPLRVSLELKMLL